MFIYVYWFSVNWKYVYECNENAIKYVYKCSLISRSVSIIIMMMKNNASLSTSPKLYFLKHTNIYIYNLHIFAWLSQQQTHTLVKKKTCLQVCRNRFPPSKWFGLMWGNSGSSSAGCNEGFLPRGNWESCLFLRKENLRFMLGVWTDGELSWLSLWKWTNIKMCCLNIPHGKLCRQS